eukprot:ANDGO_04367.mRNA.1 Histone-lysine N-methyltransferase set1
MNQPPRLFPADGGKTKAMTPSKLRSSNWQTISNEPRIYAVDGFYPPPFETPVLKDPRSVESMEIARVARSQTIKSVPLPSFTPYWQPNCYQATPRMEDRERVILLLNVPPSVDLHAVIREFSYFGKVIEYARIGHYDEEKVAIEIRYENANQGKLALQACRGGRVRFLKAVIEAMCDVSNMEKPKLIAKTAKFAVEFEKKKQEARRKKQEEEERKRKEREVAMRRKVDDAVAKLAKALRMKLSPLSNLSSSPAAGAGAGVNDDEEDGDASPLSKGSRGAGRSMGGLPIGILNPPSRAVVDLVKAKEAAFEAVQETLRKAILRHFEEQVFLKPINERVREFMKTYSAPTTAKREKMDETETKSRNSAEKPPRRPVKADTADQSVENDPSVAAVSTWDSEVTRSKIRNIFYDPDDEEEKLLSKKQKAGSSSRKREAEEDDDSNQNRQSKRTKTRLADGRDEGKKYENASAAADESTLATAMMDAEISTRRKRRARFSEDSPSAEQASQPPTPLDAASSGAWDQEAGSVADSEESLFSNLDEDLRLFNPEAEILPFHPMGCMRVQGLTLVDLRTLRDKLLYMEGLEDTAQVPQNAGMRVFNNNANGEPDGIDASSSSGSAVVAASTAASAAAAAAAAASASATSTKSRSSIGISRGRFRDRFATVDLEGSSSRSMDMRGKAIAFRQSRIHDWGLFACERIHEGDMVIEYVGEIVRTKVADMREKAYEGIGIGSTYMFKLDDDAIIDATFTGNLARFINHSCDPSCCARIIRVDGRNKICIYALRNIAIGEELTYDYKLPEEDEKIICHCGAPNCRHYLN